MPAVRLGYLRAISVSTISEADDCPYIAPQPYARWYAVAAHVPRYASTAFVSKQPR